MAKKTEQPKRWTQHVTQTSNSLDLERGVFNFDDPKKIARSLKRSAEQSNRRKAEPFRSAMSMLNFYINRAGKNLPKQRLERLEAAKDELRALYGRPRQKSATTNTRRWGPARKRQVPHAHRAGTRKNAQTDS